MVKTPPFHGVNVGSNPAGVTIFFGRLAQLGERLPYKQDVSGSSPLSPTRLQHIRKDVLFCFICRQDEPLRGTAETGQKGMQCSLVYNITGFRHRRFTRICASQSSFKCGSLPKARYRPPGYSTSGRMCCFVLYADRMNRYAVLPKRDRKVCSAVWCTI